uniref:Uncharacterized protein n=1 Tax=Romanomermis culicivorax TaxID=13658 RepID=A0A915JVZ1_ROMCU
MHNYCTEEISRGGQHKQGLGHSSFKKHLAAGDPFTSLHEILSQVKSSREIEEMASISKKKTDCGSTASSRSNNDTTFSNQNASSTDDVMNTLSEDTFLGHKCEAVRSLLSMLHTDDDLSASEKFMQMTQHKEANALLRKNGCLKSIVQLIHKQIDVTSCKPTHEDMQIVTNASTALRQAVLKHYDEGSKNREMKILSQLELLRGKLLKIVASKMAKIYTAMDTLKQLSYDEQYRIVTLELGGLQAIAETLIIDHFVFGLSNNLIDPLHTEFRWNIGATLTNLTFKSVDSKNLLCNYPKFLDVLNEYVDCDVDRLKAISAGVLRNICFKADETCRLALRNSGAARSLIRSAMRSQSNLSAVRSSLAALWNLSDFGFENDKKAICSTPGALEFLLSILRFDEHGLSTDQRIFILESWVLEGKEIYFDKSENRLENNYSSNASGILRNISQYVASIAEYRSIIRQNQGYEILLDHLKSSSLTVVANVCFCLWNFSAGDSKDGLYLIELGAQEALKGLLFSKHKWISLGSEGTMKNLASLKSQKSSTKSTTDSNSCCSNISKSLPAPKKTSTATTNDEVFLQCSPLTVQEKCVKMSNVVVQNSSFH